MKPHCSEMSVGQHATETDGYGLCVSLYRVPPNLRPLKPFLSAPILDSKYQKAADSIETTQIQMPNWVVCWVLSVIQPSFTSFVMLMVQTESWHETLIEDYRMWNIAALYCMCILCKHRNNKHTVAYSSYKISLWPALATIVASYTFQNLHICIYTCTSSARYFVSFRTFVHPRIWTIQHLETFIWSYSSGPFTEIKTTQDLITGLKVFFLFFFLLHNCDKNKYQKVTLCTTWYFSIVLKCTESQSSVDTAVVKRKRWAQGSVPPAPQCH